MKWTACFLPILAIALSGCAILGGRVDDLAFVSIEPHPLNGRLSNLRVRFSSNQNLRHLSKRYETDGAYATISLCPFHDDPSIGIGRVLHNGVDIEARPTRICEWDEGKFAGCGMANDTPDVRAEVATENEMHGPFIYEADFAYSEQWRAMRMRDGGSYSSPFPLPQVPEDLCVQVDGPSMFGSLRSNAFVIPKSELVHALETARAQPLGAPTWVSDPSQMKCETRADKKGERVVLSFGGYHGGTLVVHRLADDAWFALVADDEPNDMRHFMSVADYSSASRLELPPDLTGYRWSPVESGQQKVFTRPGDYVFYSSDLLEEANYNFGCRVSFAGAGTIRR